MERPAVHGMTPSTPSSVAACTDRGLDARSVGHDRDLNGEFGVFRGDDGAGDDEASPVADRDGLADGEAAHGHRVARLRAVDRDAVADGRRRHEFVEIEVRHRGG
jgi:hypothetical protein